MSGLCARQCCTCSRPLWHEAAQIDVRFDVGFRGRTGLVMLTLSSSAHDPEPTISRVGFPHCGEPLT
jgi:hypothetical protein